MSHLLNTLWVQKQRYFRSKEFRSRLCGDTAVLIVSETTIYRLGAFLLPTPRGKQIYIFSISTVFPARRWVQSFRNCIFPSLMKKWQNPSCIVTATDGCTVGFSTSPLKLHQGFPSFLVQNWWVLPQAGHLNPQISSVSFDRCNLTFAIVTPPAIYRHIGSFPHGRSGSLPILEYSQRSSHQREYRSQDRLYAGATESDASLSHPPPSEGIGSW